MNSIALFQLLKQAKISLNICQCDSNLIIQGERSDLSQIGTSPLKPPVYIRVMDCRFSEFK